MDRRLQKRYGMLVNSQLEAAKKVAAGVAHLSRPTSFAATQAAWRFLNNDRVTLPNLAAPLREAAAARESKLSAPFVLLAHDWCKLSFSFGKDDAVQLTHERDVGYELTTALLISADDGSPLAPMEMHLRTAAGWLSTQQPPPRTPRHLEQILPTMNASGEWKLSRPVVHVIDREADSVDHYRRWDQAGHKFLVRGDDRRVQWRGQSIRLQEIYSQLECEQAFVAAGEGQYRGRSAEIFVAESEVVLDRPAKKNVSGRKWSEPGRELPLRVVFVQLRDPQGKVLAHWKLLSNVPSAWADAAHLGRCYYWRWRIESYFKLLKTHGHCMEQWQQESGPAIARRLLVSAMACVVVWELDADQSASATEFKDALVRLSGRQMKRHRRHTCPALLGGLHILLSMLELLNHYSLDELRQLAQILPTFDTS